MTRNQKISAGLKRYYADRGGSHCKGKAGWKQTDEQKQHLKQKLIAHYDKVGRRTEEQRKAANKANVYAYRARLRNAIPEDADLSLIRRIYQSCPNGYHVDHIVALANGGKHHQDNLQYLPVSENCRKGKDRKYDQAKALDWKDFCPVAQLVE